MDFINSYVVEKHVIEEGLKARHVSAQGERGEPWDG
jgi:hypothetical protein